MRELILYLLNRSQTGQEWKKILDRLFPGLILEPKKVPVRVPVNNPQNRRK